MVPAETRLRRLRFEFDALTETEREVLDATAKQYGKLPAGRLIELTHTERTWVTSNQHRNAGSSVEIPWELFLVRLLPLSQRLPPA